MNRRLLLIIIFISAFFSSYSQINWLKPNTGYYKYNGLKADSISVPALDTLVSAPTGSIAVKNGLFYVKGTYWNLVSGVIPTFQQTLQEGSILNQTNSINIYNPNNGLISPISLNLKLGKYSTFSISDSASGRNIYTAASFDYPSYQEASHYWVNPYGTGSLSAMSLIGTTSDNQFKVYNIDGTHYFGIYGSMQSGVNDTAASQRFVRAQLNTPSVNYINFLPSTLVPTPLSGNNVYDSSGFNIKNSSGIVANLSKSLLTANHKYNFPNSSGSFILDCDTANMLSPYSKTISLTGYLKFSDTGRLSAQIVTGGTLNNVRDSLQANINAKGTGTVTSVATDYGLTGGTITTTGTIKVDSTVILPLSSITLNSSGVIHNSPITFTRFGGAWSGQMQLANQSAYKVFGHGSGSGAPSFLSLDSNYFNGLWYTYIRGSLSAGRGTTFTNGAFGLDTTQPYTWLNNQVIKSNTINPLKITNTFGTQLYNLDSSGNLSIKPGGSISFSVWGASPAYISGTQYNLNYTARNAGGVHNFYNQNNPTGASKLNMVIGGASSAIGGINELQVLQHYTGTQIMQLDSIGNMIIGSGTATDRLQVTGNINLSTVGSKLKIATGSNASVGTATMNGTTGVTVSTTAVTSSSIILLTYQSCSNCGTPYINTKTNLTSFVIMSTNASDVSTIAYQIIN